MNITWANASGQAGGQPKTGNIALLGDCVSRLFDPKSGMLNLKSINAEQKDYDCDFNNYQFTQAFWQILQQRTPTVSSISFANNRIKTLQGFHNIKEFCPNLINLSFDGNLIQAITEVDHLRSVGPRELIFTQNGIRDTPNYQKEVTRRFVSLRYLDGARIQPLIQFNLPPHVISAELPVLYGSYFDAVERKDFVVNWVTRFLSAFDYNRTRDSLLNVYAENALFSLTCKSETKQGQSKKQLLQHSDESAGPYLDSNRNLLKVHDPVQRAKTLKQGRIDILTCLKSFPDIATDLSQILCDSFLLTLGPSQCLNVTVYGNFWEEQTRVSRTFSRTFILIPASPESEAFKSGFQAIIANDMWAIQGYIGHLVTGDVVVGDSVPIETQTQPTPQPSPGNGLLGVQRPVAAELSTKELQNRQQILVKFCSITGLKESSAEQFLSQLSWDFGASLEKFSQMRESSHIGQEHFRQMDLD